MAVKLKVSKDEFQKRLNERFGTNQAPSKAGNQVLPKEKKSGATDLVTKKLQQSNVSQIRPALPKAKKSSATDRKEKDIGQERNRDKEGWINPNGIKKTTTTSSRKKSPEKVSSATDRTVKQVKDIGQERNKDKEGWVNPNGVTKAKTSRKQSPEKVSSATDRKAKDIGQERNKDKEGWVNPNGLPKSKKASATDRKTNAPTMTLTKVKSKNKTSGGKPTEKSFTKSKKNVSTESKKTAKAQIKKAFDANAVMRERRAKAMANRDKSKNPNNINLRGITKKGKKR